MKTFPFPVPPLGRLLAGACLPAGFVRTPRALLLVICLASVAAPLACAANLVVANVAELQAALNTAASGDTVVVRAGVYTLAQPLVVRDGVTVAGEGTMSFTAEGFPAGFDAAGETVLQASPALAGDLLTLGHRSSLRALALRDVAGRTTGNVVVLQTRAAADVVTASITECEIVNPNVPGVGAQGPIGRAVVAVTLNLNGGAPPAPHDGSTLTLRMTRSVVRTVASDPVFVPGCWAHNFASRSKIELVLTQNVLGGGVEVFGGNCRVDATTESAVTLRSSFNLYRSDNAASPQPFGIVAVGGLTPNTPNVTFGSPTDNRVEVQSLQDRIEGFATAIYAAGGRRATPLLPTVRGNRVELSVHGATLRGTSRDLYLAGAESFVPATGTDPDNSVRLLLSNTTGSGARANSFAHGTANGPGNRIEIVGSVTSFAQTGRDILPAPAAEFFTSNPGGGMINTSMRGRSGAGEDALVAGFICSEGSRQVLIRAVGPTLRGFGLNGALGDPRLTVYDSAGRVVAENDNWSSGGATESARIAAAAQKIGAFALPGNSLDAAVLVTLPPGAYTVQAQAAAGANGTALIEVYEAP